MSSARCGSSRPSVAVVPPPAQFRSSAALSSLRSLIWASVGSIAAGACGGRALPGDGELPEEEGGSGGSLIASGGVGGSASVPPWGGRSGNVGRGGAGFAGSWANAGGSSGGTSSGGRLQACRNPVALGGGFERCENGMVHRASASACRSSLPRARALTSADLDEIEQIARARGLGWEELDALLPCIADTDCTDGAHGYCAPTHGVGYTLSQCSHGCTSDSECGSGAVCYCGDPIGTCVAALCATDGDCAADLRCTAYEWAPGCVATPELRVALACQTPEDQCAADADCGGSTPYCSSVGDHRECVPNACLPIDEPASYYIGRPFLVGGALRLANAGSRADWSHPGELSRAPIHPLVDADPELRAELARGFTEQGLMEHASIAAFARFALQLSAAGAPPELLSATASAMEDETRHAQACFALASRYAGADVGPGALDVSDASSGVDLETTLLLTVKEGCIGETLASLEAAEAAEHCIDVETRRVLSRIAADEARHAALAWRFLAWALPRCTGDTKGRLRDVFARSLEAIDDSSALHPGARDRELLHFGIVSPALRHDLRVRCLREAVFPAAELLVGPMAIAADVPLARRSESRPSLERPGSLAVAAEGRRKGGRAAALDS